MNSQDLLKWIKKKNNNIKEMIKALKKNDKIIVLYGAGYCGQETYQLFKRYNISVQYICDDLCQGKKIDNITVTDIESIEYDERLIIFITSGFNQNMKAKLIKLNLIKAYVDIDFGRYEEDKENYSYILKNINNLTKCYNLLTDKRSKDLFIDLINYRISRDLLYINDYEKSLQYFPLDILKLSNEEVFLDLGAYDGDSIASFLNVVAGKYKKIIALEPSQCNYAKLLANTQDIKNIICYNYGAYKERAKLSFITNDDKNSFIADDGNKLLDVVSVDDLLKDEPVTFIKMDIEGAEYEAVLGAEESIKKYKPVLAVSVYHNVDDLFRILLLIETMEAGYSYYLRHYSPTVIETILYAVPQEKINALAGGKFDNESI